jgi:diaminopimelate decarboxylase
MGRFFAAPCGFYLSKVEDVKQNCGVHYAVLDGGLHQLKYDGQLSGMQIPGLTHLRSDESGMLQVISHSPAAGEEEEAAGKYTLCGSLCTTMDVLARGAYLPGLSEGDILIFHETGAYSVSEGMAAFLSRDLPSVWLWYADGRLVKARERTETYLWNCMN